MRSGRLQQADEISVKIGKLIAQHRSRMLTNINSRDIKKLWSAVNGARNCQAQQYISQLGPPFDDANAINQHFASVATDQTYDRSKIADLVEACDSDGFCFHEYQIIRALRQVKRTSQGSDPLPYWVFKECSFELAPIITHLFNRCLISSTSPQAWKQSIVTPVPKVYPPRDFNDLRPISVTPILARTFEKLFVKNFFLPSIPSNLVVDQYAFRPTGSTTAALADLFLKPPKPFRIAITLDAF
jgi:hypothetical protein